MTNTTPPTVIQNWVRSIGAATPIQMADFYSDGAILLATFETILRGKKQIKSYFVDFLDKKNMRCRILKNFTQNCARGGCQIASGLYEFTFDDENGRQSVIARYSYAVNNGLIINHHSSVDPDA